MSRQQLSGVDLEVTRRIRRDVRTRLGSRNDVIIAEQQSTCLYRVHSVDMGDDSGMRAT
jgi:hypothetical protein